MLKHYSALVAVSLLLVSTSPSGVAATLYPVPVSGWNHDIVYGAGEAGLGVTASMDDGPGVYGGNWYGVGRNTNPGAATTGLPTALTPSVSTPSDLMFQLQPFSGPNSVLLSSGQGRMLTLNAPGPYIRLALIGSTGNGIASDIVTVNFADGTMETFGGGALNQDWFGGTSVAFIANGRTQNVQGTVFDAVNANEPRLYQQIFTLANRDSNVVSVLITNNGGGNNAIMAISGEPIPEPTSLALFVSAVGFLGMCRPGANARARCGSESAHYRCTALE